MADERDAATGAGEAGAGGDEAGAGGDEAGARAGAARFGSIAEVSVALGRALRRAGIDAPVSSITLFQEALRLLGLADPAAVYWAAHSVFVRRPEDIPVLSAVFAAFWSGGSLVPVATETVTVPVMAAMDSDEDTEASDADDDAKPGLVLRYSRVEVLRHKDFASFSEEELAEAYRLMVAMRRRVSLRRSRRLRPAGRTGSVLDLRRTLRRAVKSGTEAIELATLERGVRPRRLILLVDVSGSMEAYGRALLRFAHAAVVGRGEVEAFTIGTRLTRVTRELSWRDPDAALGRAAAAVSDVAGGTRLGDAMRLFNDRYGVAGMARGAIVVVLSDGWDRGDPAVLGGEMARLSRVAQRIVWVNPLKATAGYEPLARGMAAALPYVDDFVEGHSLDALESLMEVIAA